MNSQYKNVYKTFDNSILNYDVSIKIYDYLPGINLFKHQAKILDILDPNNKTTQYYELRGLYPVWRTYPVEWKMIHEAALNGNLELMIKAFRSGEKITWKTKELTKKGENVKVIELANRLYIIQRDTRL